MALVVEHTAARQGNANIAFYSLASKQRAGGASVFHDITIGNNSVPGQAGFNATVGYDQATGLGSIDGSVLVSHWSDASVVPTFQAILSANSLSLTAGSNNSFTVKVAVGGGFNAAVAFSVTGLPSGVVASFTPAALPAPGSGSSVIKLTATSAAKAGIYSVIVSATSGTTKQALALSVTVAPAPTFTLASSATSISVSAGSSKTVTLTTTPSSGFNAAVTLSVTALPAGMTVQVLPSSVVAAPGSGATGVTFSAAANVAPKTYSVTVTATGGGVSQKQTLAVSVPGFSFASSASSATVSSTSNGTLKLKTAALGGFNAAIALSASGLPKGVTANFSSESVAAPGSGSSTLTLIKGSGAVAGSSHFTVTAAGGSVTQSASVGLIVK